MNGIIIAGTSSGVGKTTIATAIMAALTRRGLRVQPFKAGPDYIDPSYHTAACGYPCRNLDTWLLDSATIIELFHKAMVAKDVAIIEGVMGLYDGADGEGDSGSTAALAKLLRISVVLVIDASKASRSVGAMALGFKAFDRELNIAGVILNGIAGESHLQMVLPSLNHSGLTSFGYFPSKDAFHLPERHLGLVPTSEGRLPGDYLATLAHQASQTLALDRLLASMDVRPAVPVQSSSLFPETSMTRSAAIAIAMDEAFNFYYQDSLDLLNVWGAELIPFSPLRDSELPRRTTGVYFGGGFPEVYARELSANSGMCESVRSAAARNVPMYAECGGLMYLGKEIEDPDGRNHRMTGVLPTRSVWKSPRLHMGYRRLCARADNLLLRVGEEVRGHEFHFSSLDDDSHNIPAAYDILDQPGRKEGFVHANVLASYMHLHFGSHHALARRFVQACCLKQ